MGPQFQTPMSDYNGWNLDPAYQTPAYMANFRPGYDGNEYGQNPYAAPQPFLQSAWTVGPGSIPYGMDPMQGFGAAKYNVSTGLGDAAMTAAQTVGMPLASWYVASRMLEKTGIAQRMGAYAGREAVAGAWRAGNAGLGLAQKIPLLGRMMPGQLPRVPGAVFKGAGALGGFAGSWMLPIMAGEAMARVGQAGLVDPYVATRRGQDAMRANYANQYVEGLGGDTSGGFGVSATRAFDISKELTKLGAQDFSMEMDDYQKIADFSTRAGLLSDIGNLNVDQVVSTTKGVVEAVKTVVALTGNPDFAQAVQTLATLKAQGIDRPQQMESALRRMGMAGAVSGTSIDQLMATVGTQGMTMAQQSGMRGVTGMLASADAYAGFTNARKAGLVTGAQVAALGGVEGMTQSVMQGGFKAMQNPLGRMTLMGGGGFGQTLSQNVMNFGRTLGTDPLTALGEFELNQGVLMDEAMRKQGASTLMLQQLQGVAKSVGMNPQDARSIMAVGSMMGYDANEVRSALVDVEAYSDPNSMRRMRGAWETKDLQEELSKQQMEGLGLSGVPVLGEAIASWKQLKADFLSGGAEMGEPLGRATSSLSDWWESNTLAWKGMQLPQDRTAQIDTTENQRVGNTLLRSRKQVTGVSSRWQDEIGALNEMANGDQYMPRRIANSLLDAIQRGDEEDILKYGRAAQTASGGRLFNAKNDAELESVLRDMSKNKFKVEETAGPIAHTIRQVEQDGTPEEKDLVRAIRDGGDDAEQALVKLNELRGGNILPQGNPEQEAKKFIESNPDLDTGALSIQDANVSTRFVSDDEWKDEIEAISASSKSKNRNERNAAKALTAALQKTDNAEGVRKAAEDYNRITGAFGEDPIKSAQRIQEMQQAYESREFQAVDSRKLLDEGAEYAEFSLQGYEAREQYLGPGMGTYTQLMKSSGWDPVINQFMDIQKRGSGEQKTIVNDLFEILQKPARERTAEDATRAKELITKLSETTRDKVSGMDEIFGKDNMYDIAASAQEFVDKAVTGGELQAEKIEGTSVVDRVQSAMMRRGMASFDAAGLDNQVEHTQIAAELLNVGTNKRDIEKLTQGASPRDVDKMLKVAGLNPDDYRDTEAKRKALFENILERNQSDPGDYEGAEAFNEILLRTGGDTERANLIRGQYSDDSLNFKFKDRIFSDVNSGQKLAEFYNERLQKVSDRQAAEQQAAAKGDLKIDTSFVKDIGIETGRAMKGAFDSVGWKTEISANTKALQDLNDTLGRPGPSPSAPVVNINNSKNGRI